MITLDTIRQFIRTHPGKVLLVGLVAALYIAFNIWVYFYSTSSKASSPASLWQSVMKSTTSFPGLTGLNPVKKQGSTLPESSATPPKPMSTPTPTPTPKTGPGPHGCDPYGVCNLYQPDILKEACPVTFADPDCLGQCGQKEKQCKK